MLDDFRQDKNDSKETANVDLFSSQDFPMLRKVGLGTLALLVLSICTWFTMSSSSSETGSTHGIETRLTALEKAVFSSQSPINANTIATADTGPGPVGPYNNSILSNPAFPPQSDDLVLPMEEDITYDQNSGHTNGTNATPKEIALELSSLFETELAMSNTSPQQDVPTTPKSTTTSTSVSTTPTKSNTSSQAKTYTVQKGDTLSKISLKFYGTSKKWKKIVEANREKLGQNQILRAGMVIVIPEDN